MGAKKVRNFSVIAVISAVFVVAALLLGSGYLRHRGNDAHGTDAAPPGDNETSVYDGWHSFANDTYGIRFAYPPDWSVAEVAGTTDAPSASQPVTTRFAVQVKRDKTVKYGDVIGVEVLNNDLVSATAYYDAFFGQSPSNSTTKTTHDVQDRKGVQYVVKNSSTQKKLYLVQVGDGTYTFASTNEELNVQADADYWPKFDKVFNSFVITSQ